MNRSEKRIWIERAPAKRYQVWIGKHAARSYYTLEECRHFIADWLTKDISQAKADARAAAVIQQFRLTDFSTDEKQAIETFERMEREIERQTDGGIVRGASLRKLTKATEALDGFGIEWNPDFDQWERAAA